MKKRKICVITGTRAEYGLLYWTIKGILNEPSLQLQLCITGMHLSPEFGLTYREIEAAHIPIDYKVEMLLSSDSPAGISKSIGIGIIGFADAFDRLKPDMVLVLGDRFEIFAAVAAAMASGIPVAHCHGGEATEGSIDESIRHSITKMSHIHFTSTDVYRNRVIQLGETPEHVFNVSALGLENINKLALLSREEFEKTINFKLAKINFLVTFHPATLEKNSAGKQFQELLKAINRYEYIHCIFTKPNADTNGRSIIKLIDEYVAKNPTRTVSFISMGQQKYLSAIKHVNVVIGNSSSGLIEVPSFKKATVDIGDRQRGRIRAGNVIHCEPVALSIKRSIDKALSAKFKEHLQSVVNPYGEGNASEKIVNILKSIKLENILKKKFHNIKVE